MASTLEEQLQERCRLLEEALRPFAWDLYDKGASDNQVAFGGPLVRVGDYRRAVAAMAGVEHPADLGKYACGCPVTRPDSVNAFCDTHIMSFDTATKARYLDLPDQE